MSIQNLETTPTSAADYLALADSLEKQAARAMNPGRKAFQAAARYARAKAAEETHSPATPEAN